MTNENIFNKDGTQRSCPHGAALSFPVGTVQHVKVGDKNCHVCPCFGCIYVRYIICHYPNFAPQYEYSNHQT